jgi:ADP-ribose pyrophosphatase
MQTEPMRTKQLKKDVEIISHEIAFQGYFRIERYRLKYHLFEGGWSNPITREIFERGHATGVLPYDPDTNKVVLIEQFRVGALNDVRSPWLIEIVAGIVEPEEDPTIVAKREAHEEAGLDILDLTPICHYWVSPGGCTESVHLFCGRVDAAKAGGIHGLDNESEDIKVHVVDADDAFAMVRDGTINQAAAIIDFFI